MDEEDFFNQKKKEEKVQTQLKEKEERQRREENEAKRLAEQAAKHKAKKAEEEESEPKKSGIDQKEVNFELKKSTKSGKKSVTQLNK